MTSLTGWRWTAYFHA